MIPRTITFAEIRKGDRIRTSLLAGGVVESMEGVAANYHESPSGRSFWATREGRHLAWAHHGLPVTLLDRPTTPLPQEQGAPITVYRYRSDSGYEYDVERVMIREGVRFRDMSGQRLEDDQILEWAPLTPGERVTR